MPLVHGKSAKAFEKNLKTEMHAGKPLKQSLAIAYSLKRKAQHAKKAAHGGLMEHEHEEMASGYLPEPKAVEKHNKRAEDESEHEIKLRQHAFHGGKIHHEHKAHGGKVHHNPMHMEHHAHGGMAHDEKESCAACQAGLPHEHHAHGGMTSHLAGGHHDSHHVYSGHHAHGGDIVAEIMSKRNMKHMSEGGRVANETKITAGFKPNQFDDLVLRDDLEDHHNTGADDGDFIGNEREDHDRHDIVEHILKSLKKKDRMPRPA